MSEINLLRDQYQLMANTTDGLNEAIITLKKEYKRSQGDKNPFFNVRSGELSSAIKVVRQITSSLIKLGNDSSQPDYSVIPEKVADKLRNKQSELLKEGKDYKAINKSFDTNQVLDIEQFKLLDRVVSNLEKERATLFKKLRTARG